MYNKHCIQALLRFDFEFAMFIICCDLISLHHQLHRGDLMIKDMAGNTLDPLTIEAYTAAYTSPLTIPLADAMNHLKRPMVGYRAGGSELDNSMMYPYYVSALPSLQEEIKAIILMLKKFNWMHVQVRFYSQ